MNNFRIHRFISSNSLLSNLYFNSVDFRHKPQQKKAIKLYDENKKTDLSEYSRLAKPRDFVRFHFQWDCNLYGLHYILSNFANKPINSRISCEHGFIFGSYVLKGFLKNPYLNKVITFSDYREQVLAEKGFKSIKIGPYIHYADPLLSSEHFIKLKQSLGKTLLVFPCHSGDTVTLNFNNDSFISFIESIKSDFDTVLVCMYWKDIQMGRDLFYLNKGYKVVTAGHIYDTYFLPRLKTIINLADMTISNDIGTHIGYCIYLDKPHYIYNQPIEFDESKSKIEITNRSADEWNEFHTFRENLKTLFGNYSMKISAGQKTEIEKLFGFNHIVDKETMIKLIG